MLNTSLMQNSFSYQTFRYVKVKKCWKNRLWRTRERRRWWRWRWREGVLRWRHDRNRACCDGRRALDSRGQRSRTAGDRHGGRDDQGGGFSGHGSTAVAESLLQSRLGFQWEEREGDVKNVAWKARNQGFAALIPYECNTRLCPN